ncbi:MAG: PLP-dependent aminotransferase family protein [Candidatus Obscuribacterales bacterium]|nr:PLP-dependent aminotransferase family protein [Candidatus Obscuribacterales bacterium]
MDFLVVLDSQSNIPLHRQLYDEIRKAILSGRLARGQRVPSTRSLSESLGISRATVTLAYEFLLSEGYLQSTTGSGTYVCRQLPETLMRTDIKDGKKRATLETGLPKRSARRLSKYGMYLKDRPWFAYGEDEPEIQFSFGRPDMDAFPWKAWMQILGQVVKRQEFSLLDCPSKSAGYFPLREAIAAHLSKLRAVNCRPEQIIIVNGSQQGIDLVTRVLIDRGDLVGIEDPGYIGAKKAFEVAGAQLVGIPVDESGVQVERLKDPANASMKLLYLTPSHQFPSGVVLSLPRRLELLNWAQRTGTYLIEDDYDSEYRYSGRPVPSLAGLDHSETVIYIGTFSKILLPALRLGYLVVPPSLIEVFSRAKFLADRHSPLLYQETLAEFIKAGHLERHIRRMRTLYEHRRKVVIESLKSELSEKVEIMGENAGISILIRINERMDDEQFLKKARELGVGLVRTNHFYLSEAPPHEFLLNYAGLSDERILEGIKRLAQATAATRRPDLLLSD